MSQHSLSRVLLSCPLSLNPQILRATKLFKPEGGEEEERRGVCSVVSRGNIDRRPTWQAQLPSLSLSIHCARRGAADYSIGERSQDRPGAGPMCAVTTGRPYEISRIPGFLENIITCIPNISVYKREGNLDNQLVYCTTNKGTKLKDSVKVRSYQNYNEEY